MTTTHLGDVRRALARRRFALSFRKPDSHTAMGMGLLPMTWAVPARFNRGRMDARHGGLAPTPARRRRRMRVARICSCSSPPAWPRARPARPARPPSSRWWRWPARTQARCACSANRASGCNWSATSACPTPCTAARGHGRPRLRHLRRRRRRAAHRLVVRSARLRRARRRRFLRPHLQPHWWPCRCSAAAACWASTTCSSPTRPSPRRR